MRKVGFLSVLLVGLMAVSPASGSTDVALEPSDRLPDRIADPEPEGRVIDTALVFTNVSNSPSEAKFQAFDEWGNALADGHIEIPANGLVYVLASRLANAAGVEGFVGHVEAKASGRVVGSTVLLGGVVSDIDTINVVRRTRARPAVDGTTDATVVPHVHTRITFPVVATR